MVFIFCIEQNFSKNVRSAFVVLGKLYKLKGSQNLAFWEIGAGLPSG